MSDKSHLCIKLHNLINHISTRIYARAKKYALEAAYRAASRASK